MEKLVTRFVSRRESIDRWQSALRRADEKNVRLYRVEVSGAYIATSGTTTTVAYQTDGISCECAAAVQGDPVCIHRARFWQAMGMLALEVEPAPATMSCTFCRGTGEFWADGQWSADTCGACNGRGYFSPVADRIPTNVIPFPVTDDRRPAA